MSAECPWKVRVLLLVEGTIEVSAVTGAEAEVVARSHEGVVSILEVKDAREEFERDRSYPQSD